MRRSVVAVGTVVLACAVVRGGGTSDVDAAAPRAAAEAITTPRGAVRTRVAAVIAPAEAPATEPSPTRPEDTWLTREVMVAPATTATLEDVAQRHATRVVAPLGPSGFGALAVPEGAEAATLVAALEEDPDVDVAARIARTYGASRTGASQVVGASKGSAYDPGAHQWHLPAVHADGLPEVDLSSVVVAVLDTGVALETRVERGVRHVAAPSLAASRIVAPWDFINGDIHPGDDHQHGTHIASLIASKGAVRGVAPGVALMPLKVLDADDVGTELALVNGIHWAVAHGAHVINMSLSFGLGYVPSEALVDALERAADAGVVLVAAAGNEGLGVVTQPAANPYVVAVGAVRPDAPGRFAPTPYGNSGPRVDLVAPGGSVDRDRDGDGFVDGLLAETIALQAPGRVGYWLYAGTSQAAALVSGTAARLVALGVPADEVRVLLQAGARPETFAPSPFVDGFGRGRLDVRATLDLAAADAGPRPRDYYVAMLAWLEPGAGGLVRPVAMMTVLDEAAELVSGVQVAGMLEGPGGGPYACTTREGTCRVHGSWLPTARGASWVFSADAVVTEGVAFHPGSAVFAGEVLQALVSELRENTDVMDAVLGFRWTAGVLPELGNVANADLLVDLGVGKATSPVAMVMTDGALAPGWLEGSGTLHVTGGRGVDPAVRVTRRGTSGPRWSLFAVPGGALRLLRIEGTGPLHLGPRAMFAPGTPGWRPVLVGTGHAPGAVRKNARAGADLADTPVGAWLGDGGWTTAAGQPTTAVLRGAQAR